MSRREVLLVICICLLALVGATFLASSVSSVRTEAKHVATDQSTAQLSKVCRTGVCTVYSITVDGHAYLVNDQGGICPMPDAVPEKH